MPIVANLQRWGAVLEPSAHILMGTPFAINIAKHTNLGHPNHNTYSRVATLSWERSQCFAIIAIIVVGFLAMLIAR